MDTCPTRILLFPCMDGLMVLEQGSVTESLVTHTALEGTFTSVYRPHVYLQTNKQTPLLLGCLL